MTFQLPPVLTWSLIIKSASISCVGILGWYFYETILRRYVNPDERRKYFADLMSAFVPLYNSLKEIDEQKKDLFKELKSIQSDINESTRKGRPLRILEIGAGSGANFKYYDANATDIHLSVVEPNEYFKTKLLDNLKEFPGIHLANYYVTHAECMIEIEDDTFDVVVSTVVACSVSNVRKVFKEVKRVLVPGGKFLYLDHVLDQPGTFLYYKQQLLSYMYIWPLLFDGCHLNRDVGNEVDKCAFSQVKQRKFNLGTTTALWVLPYIRPHIVGVATK